MTLAISVAGLARRYRDTAALVVAALVLVIISTHAHAWLAIGHFFTTLSAAGLTGLLAALTVVLLAGGYATMRRVIV